MIHRWRDRLADKRYADWIAENVIGDPTGRCREVSQAMVAAFQELRRVRGYYFGAGMDAAWPHWWLVAPSGGIVDPTAAQWPDSGCGMYEEHSGPEPTGKCWNCGDYCYDGRSPCCSDSCDGEYAAYVRG